MIWLDTGEGQYYGAPAVEPFLDFQREALRILDSVGELRINGSGENSTLTVTLANGGAAARFAIPPQEATLYKLVDGQVQTRFSGKVATIATDDSQITLSLEA